MTDWKRILEEDNYYTQVTKRNEIEYTTRIPHTHHKMNKPHN